MADESGSTRPKALKINLDARKFGTFAEIGAGQEVVRWFFHVGKAASTIAKTISAYDMAVSDGLYGSTQRYVSRQRLEAMLDHEFKCLLDQLDQTRRGRGQRRMEHPVPPLPRRRIAQEGPTLSTVAHEAHSIPRGANSIIMDPKEFVARSEACLSRVAKWLEDFDPDEVDYNTGDGALTIEFPDGGQNRCSLRH